MSCKSLKTKALGTKKPKSNLGELKWTSLGLNQGPPDYESVALTN